MRVIGTVGLPGSGKGEIAAVAREEGIPVVTMGDVIRHETRERGLDPATDHGQVAQELRAEDGPTAIAQRAIPLVREALDEHDADAVVVDGLRSMAEVEAFEDAFGAALTVVSVEAPFDLRAERLDARGRDAGEDEGGESLQAREERELGFGMGAVMDHADVVVENTDSLESFRDRVRGLLREGLAGLDAEADRVDVRAERPESGSRSG